MPSPPIVVEPAPVATIGALGVELAGDVQVDQAVVVVVGPAGRLAGDRLAKAGGQRDVLEGAARDCASSDIRRGTSQAPRSIRMSRSPSLSKSAWQAFNDSTWSARPAASETSSNVPSPRLRSSNAPRSGSVVGMKTSRRPSPSKSSTRHAAGHRLAPRVEPDASMPR